MTGCAQVTPAGTHLRRARVPVLYIAGEGRSGSTVLSTMLGNHRGLVPVGELRAVWHAAQTDELCGCGQAFSSCEFWRAVGGRAFGGWSHVDLEDALLADEEYARQRRIPRLLISAWLGTESERLRRHRHRLQRLYRAVLEVSGSSVIVDSTKDPAYALLLRSVPEIDLRVVHLVRDSRGVAFSWSKTHVERPEYAFHPELRGTFMSSRSLARGALEWQAKNLLLHLLGLSRARDVLKYESLVANPGRDLARALQSITDLAPDGTFEADDRVYELRPFHTLGGNRIRFQRGTIDLREDDRWRRELPGPQRGVVGLVTAPLLLAYGYLGSRPTAAHTSAERT